MFAECAIITAMKEKTIKTLADIAKMANVSQSTVSRALRNNPLVSQKTRDFVQQLAQEHNFSVNATASKLRTQKTHTIAVIVMFDQNTEQSISDPFLMKLLGTIADELTKFGYDMLLTTTKTATGDWNNYYFESRRADGLIIVGQGEHDPRIEALGSNDVPFVVWGTEFANKNYTTIGSDNRKGGYLAVKHLIDKGCKNIAFMGDIEHNELEQRWLGYLDACNEAGLEPDPALRIKTDLTSNDGYQQIKNFLEGQQQKIDAIFAVSDTIALGVMKYLHEQKIAIPKEIAIIGFDDIAMSAFSSPSLTTVRQNTTAAGELLVSKVLKKIEHKPIKSKLLEVELIVRQSSEQT
ncbi:LacI family DNA-binding transcriptional regulator [Thalassomonas haliotis]|nr:LacI family DNA-binding transcriptional regulator [Thalassomonas haliotis]